MQTLLAWFSTPASPHMRDKWIFNSGGLIAAIGDY
jgi:hypothetical protein